MALVGRRSASVITSPIADGMAAALCVLGPERALKFIERTNGTAALYVYEKGEQVISLPSKRFALYRIGK